MNKVIYSLKTVYRDQDRKSIPRIIWEAIHCIFLEWDMPYYYFISLLYKKGAPDYRNFIGHRKNFGIQRNYLRAAGPNFDLFDKTRFGKILSDHNIPSARVLAHNAGHEIIRNGSSGLVANPTELALQMWLLLAETRSQSIFVKPIEGEEGVNSFRFDEPEITAENCVDLFRLMETVSFIFQETIKQHPILNSIYPHSINSLRVHSFFDQEKNDYEIVSVMMRIGRKGAVVDNCGVGGLYIAVDLENWTLGKFAQTYLSRGGHRFTAHPDTGHVFAGTKLPFREESLDLVKAAAPLFTSDFIGWDVALTESGPVILEGNENPHLGMAQWGVGGFKNHPRYKEIFKNYI